MQAMPEIILRQLDRIAVQYHFALVDSVGVTSDRCTEIAWNVYVVGYTVEAKDNIFHFSVFVRYHNRYDTSAEVGDAYFHARFIL